MHGRAVVIFRIPVSNGEGDDRLPAGEDVSTRVSHDRSQWAPACPGLPWHRAIPFNTPRGDLSNQWDLAFDGLLFIKGRYEPSLHLPLSRVLRMHTGISYRVDSRGKGIYRLRS